MPLKKPFWGRFFATFLLIFYALVVSLAQSDSIDYALRKKIVISGNAVASTSLLTGLYFLWYKDYPQSSFHFHNDNDHWNQMDKLGHSFSCYYEGLVGIKMMKWAGYNHLQSTLIGGSYGLFLQTVVEVFDGFSENWGASGGDIAANFAGTGLLIGQSLAWDEQRIKLKFSFTPSSYATYRPNVLGNSFTEQMMKDYNGQSYWLSVNPKSFMPQSKWPSWLNIAVGYGSKGMISGSPGNIFENDAGIQDFSYITRYREFYLSPDIDLSKIHTEKPVVRSLLIMLNCLKFPLPTLGFNEYGIDAYALKF